MRRRGKRWAKLHRLVYLAAVAGVLHFWLLVKSDVRLPVTFAFILFLLLGYRVLIRIDNRQRAVARAEGLE